MGSDVKRLNNGNWDFSKKVKDDEKIMQDIQIRLLEVKGDAFWSLDSGIEWDYFKQIDDAMKKNILLNIILQTEGVTNASIQEFNERDGIYYISFVYKTVNGNEYYFSS